MVLSASPSPAVPPPSGAPAPAGGTPPLRKPHLDGTAALRDRLRTSLRHSTADGMHDLRFRALGTQCQVQWIARDAAHRALGATIIEWMAGFEATYSRYLPGSLISQINAAAGTARVAIDAETERLFALCDQLHFLSRGAFDPTALPLLQLWDWKAARPTIPSDDAIAAARRLVGWRRVQRGPGWVFLPEAGMGLDLGGMGKEFAVDYVAEMLARAGVPGGLVDFGADVRVVGLPADGRPGWHVGLDDPRQPGRCWRGLGLKSGAVATSGDYIRRFELGGRRFGHILDLRTGRPVDNGCLGVSVVAPTCTQAGLLSTSAFVLGPDEGLRLIEAQYGTAGAIVTTDAILTSRQFHTYVAS